MRTKYIEVVCDYCNSLIGHYHSDAVNEIKKNGGISTNMETFVMKIVVNYLKLKYLFQLVKNEIIDFILFGKTKRKVVDHVDYTECEVEYRGRFNKVVGYYAYGFSESEIKNFIKERR